MHAPPTFKLNRNFRFGLHDRTSYTSPALGTTNLLPEPPRWGFMFTDLLHLIHPLEHDYKEEKRQKVHSYDCRRCALAVRLNGFKGQILVLLRDIEFAIGEPLEKNKRS
jgi:hypothetical protein